MIEKMAVLFPGQGAQKVGMLSRVLACAAGRALLEEAEDVLGYRITSLIQKGPLVELSRTVHAQAAIVLTSYALWNLAHSNFNKPSFYAGHSIGEYTALLAAGALSLSDALKLAQLRGKIMDEEIKRNKLKGAMLVLTIDDHELRDLERLLDPSLVSIALFNSKRQIVLSGDYQELERIRPKLAGLSWIQSIKTLSHVSAAFHSPQMRGAMQRFREEGKELLGRIKAVDRETVILSNVTGRPHNFEDLDSVKESMVNQICWPVRWSDTIAYLDDCKFVVVGPTGRILRGFMPKEVETINE